MRIKMTSRSEVQRAYLREDSLGADNSAALEEAIIASLRDAKARADKKLAEATKRMMAELGHPASPG